MVVRVEGSRNFKRRFTVGVWGVMAEELLYS